MLSLSAPKNPIIDTMQIMNPKLKVLEKHTFLTNYGNKNGGVENDVHKFNFRIFFNKEVYTESKHRYTEKLKNF